jgi:hypothetical protein
MTAVAIDTDLLVGGAANLFAAPWGLASPGEPEPAPADTVAFGTEWEGNFAFPGSTSQGVKFSKAPKTVDWRVEEQAQPANVLIDTQDISIDTILMEETLANLKLAFGGGTIATVAPGVGQPGKSTLTLSDTLDFLTVGFDVLDVDGMALRVYIPKVVSVATVAPVMRRAAAPRMYQLTLRAICATSAIDITYFTAPAT